MNKALLMLLVANAELTSKPLVTKNFLNYLMELKPANERIRPSVNKPLVLILLKKKPSAPSKSLLLIMAQLTIFGSRCLRIFEIATF